MSTDTRLPPATWAALARHAPSIAEVRSAMDAAAAVGTPGCLLTLVAAVAGAVGLMYVSTWDADWWQEPRTLGALVAYPVAIWAVAKAAGWVARPRATVAETAWQRLVDEIVPDILSSVRPGARFDSAAHAAPDVLVKARLARLAPTTSGNGLRWHAHGLDLEMYSVVSREQSDGPGPDLVFAGLLSRARLPEVQDDFWVAVRSRRTLPGHVDPPFLSTALPSTGLDDSYHVISNWEPFARRVLTSDVTRLLHGAAASGRCVHVAVASGHVWVGIEHERSWFADFPAQSFRFLNSLDDAHLAAYAADVDLAERLADALARAVRLPPAAV